MHFKRVKMSKRGYGSWAMPAAGAIAAGRNFYNAAKRARTGAKRSARGRTRARGRAPPVRTRTKVSLHQRGKQCGQAGSFSSFFYGRRLVPKRLYNAYKAIAPQIYQTNISGYCPVTSGKQNTCNVASAFCGNNVFVTQGIQADLLSINNAVNTMNGGNVTRKYLLESVSGEIMLQNQTNMNTRVILYDIIARRTIDSQTALNTGPWMPSTAWSVGEYNETVGSAANNTVIGSTPFQSSQFTTYFKVLKATHQLMAPGQTHVHRFKFTPNRVLLGEEEQINNGNIKGLTIYTMMVISGVPCDNNATTDVSTSDGKIDFVTRKSYRFKTILDDCVRLTAANNLSIIPAAQESVMNVESGAAVTFSKV